MGAISTSRTAERRERVHENNRGKIYGNENIDKLQSSGTKNMAYVNE
jgi:hypothetical protein